MMIICCPEKVRGVDDHAHIVRRAASCRSIPTSSTFMVKESPLSSSFVEVVRHKEGLRSREGQPLNPCDAPCCIRNSIASQGVGGGMLSEQVGSYVNTRRNY